MSGQQGTESLLARIQSVERTSFEHFIGDLFSGLGWESEVTKQNDEQGIDVIARRSEMFEQKVSIQVKQPDPGNKVNKSDVREYSAIDRDDIDTDVVMLATSAPFTKDGYEYGRDNNVKLLDGRMIIGILNSQEFDHLVDDYIQSDDQMKDNAGSFPVQEDAREEYLQKRPIDTATRIFKGKDLLDAIDLIRDSEIGRNQVHALHSLVGVVENGSGAIPTDIVSENPSLVNGNWYQIQQRDDLVSKIPPEPFEVHQPAELEILCFQSGESLSLYVFLPTDAQITPQEFSYLEACVDYINNSIDEDVPKIEGRIYGKTRTNLEGKRERHRTYGFKAKTYQQMVERVLQSNLDLLRAARPYFKISEQQDIVEDIDELLERVN